MAAFAKSWRTGIGRVINAQIAAGYALTLRHGDLFLRLLYSAHDVSIGMTVP